MTPTRRTVYEVACLLCSERVDTVTFLDGRYQGLPLSRRCQNCGGNRYVDFSHALVNERLYPSGLEDPEEPRRKKQAQKYPRVCEVCGRRERLSQPPRVALCEVCSRRMRAPGNKARWRERVGK